MLRWVVIGVALSVVGCPSPEKKPPPAKVSALSGVQLTAPWTELKLPLSGGVVLSSDATVLSARFPTTPDQVPALAGAVRDELVAHGWTVVKVVQASTVLQVHALKTPQGRDASLTVIVNGPQTDLEIVVR